MASKIQIKRGSKSGLPSLAPGEFGLCTDTKELFVGTPSGNVPVAIIGSNGKIPSSIIPDLGYLPISGGTLTGNLEGKYIKGTWLAGTENNHLDTTPTKICVQDSSGWIYHRTLDEMRKDIGNHQTVRFVVGTSTAGWTSADCDYLCDGTADNVEINAAIQALPSTGGEVVILDGTYNITATIAMNKDNITLSGNGDSTILKRMWNSSSNEGVVTITSENGGCTITNLQIDGNVASYSSILHNYGILMNGTNSNDGNVISKVVCNNNNLGIYIYNYDYNFILGNIINNNKSYGIRFNASDTNVVSGNICNNNGGNGGFYFSTSDNNIVNSNICNNNEYGIYLNGGDNNTIASNSGSNNVCGIRSTRGNRNTISSNNFIRGTGQTSDYTDSQYTIYFSSTGNNYNLIANNNIMGKNYTSGGGTSNTFVNNKYN